jgi:hypothetical protein
VRLLLEARGGTAADALVVRTPAVERAVDDKDRASKPYDALSWKDDLDYDLLDRSFRGFPQDGLRSVLFLECPDGKVKSVTVEGRLEMLAGGKDVNPAFKKFESNKMRKLKNSSLKKAGLQVEVRTDERPGLFLTFASSERDLDDLMLVNRKGEWATGID